MWETEHSQVTDVDADRLWSVLRGYTRVASYCLVVMSSARRVR